MKKSTKILALCMCAVLALSVMAFGFAKWSTDVTLGGTVAANGKWDVKVTDASLELSSAGAAMKDFSVEKSMNSKLEGIDYFVSSISSKLAMNTKIEELKAQGAVINSSDYEVKKYQAIVSYKGGEGTVNETVGTYDTIAEADDAKNARSAELKADGVTVYSTKRSVVWTYSIDYTATVAADEVNGAVFTDTAVDYADVEFSLPGAWANYKVTVTNEGTVNANLENYSFDFTELNADVYDTDAPSLEGCVLAPGESCSFNFVVKVKDTDAELNAEAASFSVALTYAQDTVNEAPAAGHSH